MCVRVCVYIYTYVYVSEQLFKRWLHINLLIFVPHTLLSYLLNILISIRLKLRKRNISEFMTLLFPEDTHLLHSCGH